MPVQARRSIVTGLWLIGLSVPARAQTSWDYPSASRGEIVAAMTLQAPQDVNRAPLCQLLSIPWLSPRTAPDFGLAFGLAAHLTNHVSLVGEASAIANNWYAYQAQCPPAGGNIPAVEVQENEKGKGRPMLFVVSALYDAKTRTTGEFGVLVPLKLGMDEDAVFLECRCLEATAGVGPGGSRFAVGPSSRVLWRPILPFGWDGFLTIQHTSDSPRRAMPHSTYVGGEAGLVFMSVRIGLGVAHRASGPGPRDTVFTWNVGLRTLW